MAIEFIDWSDRTSSTISARRLRRRAGVERRLRVVLDGELHRLGDVADRAGGRAGVSAMSMPADTPAAVMILAPLHHPLLRRSARRARRAWLAEHQCVVASMPSSSPAAPSRSEPVHTDVVHVVVGWTARSQSTIGWSGMRPAVSMPPGTTTMSGAVTSSKVAVAVMGSRRVWSVTGPTRSATHTMSWSGTSASDLEGPDDVERGEPFVEGECDLHARHRVPRAGRPPCRVIDDSCPTPGHHTHDGRPPDPNFRSRAGLWRLGAEIW